MSRRHILDQVPTPTPAPTPTPTVSTAITGALQLQLPDDLAERIATAIVAHLLPPPAEGRAGRDSPDWWWTPINQKEASAFLGTSPTTMATLRRQKDLPVSYALGRTSPRYYRAQLVSWQLGLPIPLPPWSSSSPMDWLWFPLSPEEAAGFLRCGNQDLETWQQERDLPCRSFPGVRYYFRAQLLAWLLEEPIPQSPRWED